MVTAFVTALVLVFPALVPEILQVPTFSPFTLPPEIEQIFDVEDVHLITNALLVFAGRVMVLPTFTLVTTDPIVCATLTTGVGVGEVEGDGEPDGVGEAITRFASMLVIQNVRFGPGSPCT